MLVMSKFADKYMKTRIRNSYYICHLLLYSSNPSVCTSVLNLHFIVCSSVPCKIYSFLKTVHTTKIQ
nr:hypothetical protein Itr_chr13CG13920 [Ipomoea trifida]GMC58707.1 hypothetical protein Iba_chr02aCG17850 [Ipomoea batatas]